jgi:predicted metal-dependent phosphoesterase TrpH
MQYLKGIIHVHSNYSYDGRNSVQEIVQFAKNQGYSFLGMSEHSDTLNEEKMAQYVQECHLVSDPDCLVIPGIEFSCEGNLHLVGLGVHHYTDHKDPIKIAQFIHKEGGIAIIAHPIRYNYRIPPQLVHLVDGIEVWNSAYDGRFIPNDRSLELLKEMRRENKSLRAFGAVDLHRITHHIQVTITLPSHELKKDVLLYALKEGNTIIDNGNRYFTLDSKYEPHWLNLIQIRLVRWTYLLAKAIRDLLLRISTTTATIFRGLLAMMHHNK